MTDDRLHSIDFSSYLNGCQDDKIMTAAAIDDALTTTGFFFVYNHGISEALVQKCFQASNDLHNLPSNVKDRLPRPSPSHVSGYSLVGNEIVRGTLCSKEGFACGNFDVPEEAANWPPEDSTPVRFRESATELYRECSRLLRQLLDCLSLALGLHDGDSLSQYHSGTLFNLDFIHYPAISAHSLRSGEIGRLPAHSDFGTLTLLFQDSAGGLEIADPCSSNASTSADFEKHGRFFHVDPRPGCILVNAGYILKRWTNGRWKSAIHRVTEPSACWSSSHVSDQEDKSINQNVLDGTIPERYSIAFFGFPDPHTIVDALPGTYNDQHAKKWGPLNAGDYLKRKRAAVFSYNV